MDKIQEKGDSKDERKISAGLVLAVLECITKENKHHPKDKRRGNKICKIGAEFHHIHTKL